MKTAIYIEDGIVQLVITPESEFEKNSLSTFSDKPLDAKLFAGSFYDCRGGWVMQAAYRQQSSMYGSWNDNHRDASLILVAREAEPPPALSRADRLAELERERDALLVEDAAPPQEVTPDTHYDLSQCNPMVAAALRAFKDATGLCTVREWAESVMQCHDPLAFDQAVWDGSPRTEMTFTHNGRRYNVEMVVTRVESL